MNKRKQFFPAMLFIILLLSLFVSCADKLNEEKSEDCEKLATALGIKYPINSGGFSGGGINGNLLNTGYFYSYNILSSDYLTVYIGAGSSKSFPFSISSGYIMYMQYYDSRAKNYTSILADNGKSSGKATPVVYTASGSEFGTISSTGINSSKGAAGGNYTLKLNGVSSGYVSIRVFQLPTSVSNTIYPNSGQGSSFSALTRIYLSSNSPQYYKFYATRGTTYNLRFYDSETKENSSITATSSYNFIDCAAMIYSVTDGTFELLVDDSEFDSFTPSSSGYYILTIGKACSSVENGYVWYRLYK